MMTYIVKSTFRVVDPIYLPVIGSYYNGQSIHLTVKKLLPIAIAVALQGRNGQAVYC